MVYVYVCVCVCMCVCVCVYVYVCVCVIYIYSALNIFHTIPVVDYFQLTGPIAIPALLIIQRLPCYTPTTIRHRTLLLDLLLSCRPLMSPLYLTLPRRDQCHHRPIRQIISLMNARPFLLWTAEDKAVRPQYC